MAQKWSLIQDVTACLFAVVDDRLSTSQVTENKMLAILLDSATTWEEETILLLTSFTLACSKEYYTATVQLRRKSTNWSETKAHEWNWLSVWLNANSWTAHISSGCQPNWYNPTPSFSDTMLQSTALIEAMAVPETFLASRHKPQIHEAFIKEREGGKKCWARIKCFSFPNDKYQPILTGWD